VGSFILVYFVDIIKEGRFYNGTMLLYNMKNCSKKTNSIDIDENWI